MTKQFEHIIGAKCLLCEAEQLYFRTYTDGAGFLVCRRCGSSWSGSVAKDVLFSAKTPKSKRPKRRPVV